MKKESIEKFLMNSTFYAWKKDITEAIIPSLSNVQLGKCKSMISFNLSLPGYEILNSEPTMTAREDQAWKILSLYIFSLLTKFGIRYISFPRFRMANGKYSNKGAWT